MGSVQAIVDSSGSIVESYQYDAWGNTSVFDGSGNPLQSSAVGNRYCWQGREISWKTGLYFFRARWYEPVTGRWLSDDPIGINGGLNQYVFCENDPVNFVDPEGLDVIAIPIGVGAGGGAIVTTVGGAVGVGAAVGIGAGVAIDSAFGLSDQIGNAIGNWMTPVDPLDPAGKAGHKSKIRPSSKSKHDNGDARRLRDRGREKGDDRRRPPRRKPKGWPGPWPPSNWNLTPSDDSDDQDGK